MLRAVLDPPKFLSVLTSGQEPDSGTRLSLPSSGASGQQPALWASASSSVPSLLGCCEDYMSYHTRTVTTVPGSQWVLY